jgi:site-specific recombinase XerD
VIHWLRHAHASHAIDNGAPITGHSDLKTTSVYAHARPGERQQWPVFEDEVLVAKPRQGFD